MDTKYLYQNGNHTYTYIKPLEQMTKKELFHFLKLNRNRMKQDIKEKRYVNYYIYEYVTWEGYLLLKEIEKRNRARGKGTVKSDARHIGGWWAVKAKYEKYMNECIGIKSG